MNAPLSPLAVSASHYQALKTELMQQHGLAEDDPALLDTLDGASDLGDVLAAMVRRAKQLEAYGDSLGEQIRGLQDRKAGHGDRAKKLRALVCHYLDVVGLKRLERADFVASARWTRPGLVGLHNVDTAGLPDHLVRIKREPDATAIRDAIEAGEIVAGVSIGNSSRTLAIR